jgi:hypothetical protein
LPDTLKTIRTSVLNWLRGDYALATDVPTVNEAINDAIAAIWNQMILTQYERLFGAQLGGTPLTFNAPAGAQRVQLTSIADPTVAPVVGNVGGGALPLRSYQLLYTWVTESGTETGPSPVTAAVNIPANTLANISPPSAPTSGFPPFGWNLYSTGPSNNPALTVLQNQDPIGLGVTFTEPVAGFKDYGTTNQYDQQPPVENTTGDNIAWIDHLEVVTSDTLMRSWNQVSLDSEVMRRMARTLSSASEYQHYVWDLVGDNVIEIRPPLGLTFTPRYWPVLRPRRLAYDQALVPYVYIQGVREFIVSKAVADLKLGVDEYLAFKAWSDKAGTASMDVKLAMLAENWKKDSRIVPHLW